MRKHIQKKILVLALATTFVSSFAYSMDTVPADVVAAQSSKGLLTVNAKTADFISILGTEGTAPTSNAMETEGQRTTPISTIKETNDQIKKNIELLLGTKEQKIEFLDWCYTRWAPGLLNPAVHGHGALSLEDAQAGHAIFQPLYEKMIDDVRFGVEVKLGGDHKVKFNEKVSKWGDAKRAAWMRVQLENLLDTPGAAERIVNLINGAYFLDYANPEVGSLPANPGKQTQYFFVDAKTSDVATANPNNKKHILGDKDLPGGGVLKGTFLQEEATVTAEPEALLALLAISDFAYPLKDLQAVTVGDSIFVPMVDLRPEKKEAPELAADYVKTVVAKMDAVVSAAILGSQNQPVEGRTLILGAAGCGAFVNDPVFMAEVFNNVLTKYHGYFDKVGFAILNGDKELVVRDKPESGLKFQPFKDLVSSLQAKYNS